MLVEAALDRRSGLDEAAATAAFRALDPRDRGFARAAALTTLRRLGPIDRVLAARMQKPPPPPVTTLLRLALAQAWFMEVPAFAAVNATVDQAGADPATRPFKALINGVLRTALREGPPADDPEANAPPWLFARWRQAYGEEAARAIAQQIPAEPLTDVTCLSRDEAAAVAEALGGRELGDGTVRTPLRGDVSGWPGYDEGRWWVQDAAAAAPARLLDVAAGETVLDLCAAPGGKTLQLAAAGASVTALDRSKARLNRLRENLTRTSLSAEVVAADALTWTDRRTFDAVLLDAPCASTGTFRRNPDVLWALKPSDIAALAEAQARLLDAAAGRVRPGGRLVYCVCSLEPEEGEAQADAFLSRRGDFELAPIAPNEAAYLCAAVTSDGRLRVLPHHLPDGVDGFFAARFRRRG